MNFAMNEETLFIEALEIRDPAARSAFLDRACAGDAVVRGRLERLLDQHDRAGSFLGRPVVALAETASLAAGGDSTGTLFLAGSGELVGTTIGAYKLLQQLGEGGMGTVFMAEQTHPVQRKVALKLIKAGMDSKQVLARFEAERQALALMDHPNIARVLDAGTTDRGLPYFVMELVKGVPITRYCDDHHLTCEERLGLFVSVCHAVQHAHQKGIIHRDLKPSNVMVCLYDGKPVPKVIDFGVAKATGQKLTDKTLFTEYGSVVGTLEYMSPEQAEVNQLDVDTRSDVYSLGVLLYELLTGTTPLERKRFQEVTFLEVLRLIREEDPPRPSTRLSAIAGLPSIAANRGLEPKRLGGLVRGELDWIAMRALEKDRARRYETANGLAADVQRYLNDETVQACPPSAGYRLRKFARRNRAGVLMGTAIALGLALAVGSALVVQAANTTRVVNEQRQTKDALDREKETTDALMRSLASEERTKYFRNIALAERELAAGNVGRAEELLDECPVRLRGWEWHHLKRRPYGPLTFRDHGAGVWSAAFNPDGSLIASASINLFFGQILIWEAGTGKVLHRILAHNAPIEGVAFSPSGKHLASASWDKTVKVWDAASGKELFPPLRGHSEYVRCVAFSRDGKYLASAGGDHAVLLWDARTFQKLRVLNGHSGGVYAIAFGNDGRLASASSDGTIRVWNTATGAEEHVLRGHADLALALAFSHDGKLLASGGLDGTARVWNPETGRHIQTLQVDLIAITCVAFSRDGRRLAAGSLEKSLRVMDLESEQEAVTLRGHKDTVMAVAFSPDGQQLTSASLDGTVRVWDSCPSTSGPRSIPLFGHNGGVFGVAFQPGRANATARLLLASASWDETVKFWDAKTGELVRTLTGHGGPVFRVAFSRDGQRMISTDFTSVAKVWDTTTFKELRTFRAFAGVAALSPDGRRIAFTAEGASLHVRDVETGEEVLPPFRAHDVPIVTVAFNPDGKHLATGSWDGTTKLWDVVTGRLVRTFAGHGIVAWVTFSEDGKRLATASWDKTVRVWDTATGDELLTLRGHEHRVLGVAFSPDGRYLATASQDSTVRIWDSETGKLVTVLHGHVGYVLSVAFSADGKRLASSGGYRAKGDVRIWETSQWERSQDRK